MKSDDRKAMLVGIALWIVGLGLVIGFLAPLTAAGDAWYLWTCVAGLGLGLVGILYTRYRHH